MNVEYYDRICSLAQDLTDEQSEKVVNYIKSLNGEVPGRSRYNFDLFQGKYEIPDDIDGFNGMIAEMFGVAAD